MKSRTFQISQAVTTALLLTAGALTIQAQPYPAAVNADNPTSYWPLNETSGTTAYDQIGGDNGSYLNVNLGQEGYAEGLAGQFGYATPSDTSTSVGFGEAGTSSTGSYVSGIMLDKASVTNAEFSVEAWVNGFEGQIGGAGIVGKGYGGGGEEFYIDCGGTSSAFRFFIRGTNGTAYSAASAVVPDGNWHHLVGVCDETNSFIYLYVDGRMVASNSSASGGIHATTNLYMTIGARQSGKNTAYDDQFSGYIDQVAVYPVALSAQQVLNHYVAAGIPPSFTVQPPNSLTVNEGTTVTVTAAVEGTLPLSYQWTTNGVAMAGQTNLDFVLTNIQASLNGGYLVLNVTNQYGSAQSYGVSLGVNYGSPGFLTNLQPGQLSLYTGEPWTYSVAAEGNTPFYYQWLLNGTAIPNATNSSYTVETLAGTNSYTVNVSNSYNGGSVSPSTAVTLTGVTAPTNIYPATIISSSPIAFWRLDEPDNGSGNSGSTAYDYVGGHYGTYNQALLGVSGYSTFDTDTAAAFGTNANASYTTGSYMQEVDNSYQGVPTIESILQGQGMNAVFTVECWVKAAAGANSSSGSPIIALGNPGSDSFVVDCGGPNGSFRFYLRNAANSVSYLDGSSAPDGNWHHLVATCDEANTGAMILYVDGNIDGTIGNLKGLGLYAATVPFTVGAEGAYQFNGIIDEVSVYTNAFTQAEVLAHYNSAPEIPRFTAVPPATVAGYLGDNVTLTASVLGSAPFSCQWYSNTFLLSAQTNLYLTLTNIKSGTNNFVLKVSNAYGSITDSGTIISVAAGSGPPSLLSDVSPLAVSLYVTKSITYSVTVSGSTPMYYQWWFDGQAVSGATNSSYNIPSLGTNNSGSYYCTISNSIANIQSSTSVLTVVALPTNPYTLTVLADHPVAYYRMDETNGSTIGYDYAGGNNGTYSNTSGITHVAGCYGAFYDDDTAALFNGTGVVAANFTNFLGGSITNVDFAVPNGASGAFSVEAWAQGTTASNQMSGGGIVAKGVGNADEQFSLDAHTGFRFYVRNQASATSVAGAQAAYYVSGTTNNTIPSGFSGWRMDGIWHHLVGVCDQVNSNILLYVDGTLIGPNIITNGVVPPLAYALDLGHNGSTGTNGVIYPGTGIHEPTDVGAAYWYANSVSIGSRNQGSGNKGIGLYFQGGVDEVALYNYALSPLQVSNHYAVAKDTAVTLNIQMTNGLPVLSWSSAWVTAVLQSATNVSGPWVNIPGATTPYTVTNTTPALFYRVRQF